MGPRSTILVTGGAGYIGSHTCLQLLQAGHDVVVADALINSTDVALDRVRAIARRDLVFHRIDLRDPVALARVFELHPIDAVIHFAGLKAVGESARRPLHYYDNNLGATLGLLRAMEQADVRRLVFSSSATVYGQPPVVPVSEDAPLAPESAYGRSKLFLEQVLRDLCAADPAWEVTVLRYFNPVGAHPSGLLGEDPLGPPLNLMPVICRVAVGQQDCLEVFGNDYDTADGTCVRDYIHVQDLARGHVAALRPATWSGLRTYNLGTGRGLSVLDVVAAFERACGVRIPRRVVAQRPGDVGIYFADPSRARNELQWRAEHDIDTMCRDAWRWQSLNPRGYRTG